jgi:hypothetical protein
MDMSDNDVRVVVRLRLGLPLSELAQPFCPLCGDDMRDSQITPLGASSCDAEASSSGMTAARMVPARTSALCMSTEDSFKVPDLDFVFADKCVLVDVSGTDPWMVYVMTWQVSPVTLWPSAQAPSTPSTG